MIFGKMKLIVLFVISFSIINLFSPLMVMATLTFENLYAPEWNNERQIEKFKEKLEQYLSNIDLKKFVELVSEKKIEELRETLEGINMAKYLRQFLFGYGEEGKTAQYVQLIDDVFLVRWPVPIARTKELNRKLREGLKLVRNEVDGIFRNFIGIEPYKGICPIWIEYSDDRDTKDTPRTAGTTIGAMLIFLYIPISVGGSKDHTWQLPGHEIESLLETAKHEIVHFYINRCLGYYKSRKLPRDFHEGLATGLINQSIKRVAEIRTEFLGINSYVRTTKIIEAPEDYKRYHLQIKYLRLNYGDAPFNAFLRKVLSGEDIDQSVKESFEVSSWRGLFPPDLSLWIVEREIGLKGIYIFMLVILCCVLLIAILRLNMSSSRRYIVVALFRTKGLISQIQSGRDRFFKLHKRYFLLKPRNLIIITSIVMGAVIFDLYRKWCLTLNIDTPASLFSTFFYFDSFLGAGVIISAIAIFPINFLFLKRLEKEIKKLQENILSHGPSNSIAEDLNQSLLFEQVFLKLKRMEPTFKFFPSTNRIISREKEIKSILETLVLQEISEKVSSYLLQGLFEDAYYIYDDYLDKIRRSLSDKNKAEVQNIAENIVRKTFEKVTSLIDSGNIEEAEDLIKLMKIRVEKEGLEGESQDLVLKADVKIWVFVKKIIEEELKSDESVNGVDYLEYLEKLRILFPNMSAVEFLKLFKERKQ